MNSISGLIREFTSSAIDSEAREGDRPVVLLFSAAQCPASRRLEQMINDLAPDYGDRLRFVSLNAAKDADLQQRFHIHSTPSLVVLHHGQVLYQALGVLPRRELEAIFDAAARCSDHTRLPPANATEN